MKLKNIFTQFKNIDFSSKVRWRIRYDKNYLFVTLLDKYKVRNYVETKGIKTAKILYVTEKPETIPFDKLPDKYLIKATHGSGWNLICLWKRLYLFGNGIDFIDNDGSFLKEQDLAKEELSRTDVIKLCKKWLNSYYSKEEWGYQHISPKIIIEELLEAKDGNVLKDYRMYTFHGKVKVINVGSPIYRKNNENVFFNHEWNEIKLTNYKESLPNPLPLKPTNLKKMIKTAQIIGEGIDFARIDLYDTTQGIILGEITMYPQAGKYNSPTTCPVFNKWLGDQWNLGKDWKYPKTDFLKDLFLIVYVILKTYTIKPIRKYLPLIAKRLESIMVKLRKS